MTIDLTKIAGKWQKEWRDKKVYQTKEGGNKPKYYILDMFPYPSGAGLHVGHPKGYIASDTIARKKLLQGYNVLHPMGFDTFGLGTEQYAIDHKMKPQVVAKKNIDTYIKQLENIGFTYDWDRSFSTADPEYYKWTQSIFLKFYNCYYDEIEKKAKPISELESSLKAEGKSEEEIKKCIDNERLAYIDYKPINWCPHCKTGLANEDLDDGKCERCGSLVEQKPMKQWVLRITKYAERLLDGLEDLDWDESMKELERNWIGKSSGTQFKMNIKNSEDFFEVYTTRIDTVFGMTFVVMAPEHPLVDKITTSEYKNAVELYKEQAKYKTQLERTELQKEKTGQFTGAYAINPFNGKEVPIYIGDYVLANYGTGVVMAVPAHDERDYDFAKKHNIPIDYVIGKRFGEKKGKIASKCSGYAFVYDEKTDSVLMLDTEPGVGRYKIPGGTVEVGETILEGAMREVKEETGYNDFSFVAELSCAQLYYQLPHLGVCRENNAKYFLLKLNSDSQQEKQLESHEKNYPVVKITLNDLKKSIDAMEDGEDGVNSKRVLLSVVDSLEKYLLGENIAYTEKGVLIDSGDFSGMGSDDAIKEMQIWLKEREIGSEKINYKIQDWVFSRQRYWGEPFPVVFCPDHGTVPLKDADLPLILPDVEHYEPTGTEEGPLAEVEEWINTFCPVCGKPAKRESNTMPGRAGSSWYWLRYMDPHNHEQMVSKEKNEYWRNVDVYIGGAEHVTRHMIYARFWQNFLYDLGIVCEKEPFKKYQKVGLIMAEDGRKMSKRWGNVVNPDDIIGEYGSDVFRTYEMFMGPFDQYIARNTNGIKGAKKFLDKLIALRDKVDLQQQDENIKVNMLLHQTIKKLTYEIDEFKFNTSISQLMIFVNFLTEQEKITRSTFEKLILLVAPFAPHLAEEFWSILGNEFSIFTTGEWPKYDESYLVEAEVTLAIQFNGKMRGTLDVAANSSQDDVLEAIKKNDKLGSYLGSGIPKKIIYIPGKIMNIIL